MLAKTERVYVDHVAVGVDRYRPVSYDLSYLQVTRFAANGKRTTPIDAST